MLKLTQPNMSDQIFRREFSSELDFLSGETTFIEIKCRAGGWLNHKLIKLRDDIELNRQIQTMQAAEFIKDREKFAKKAAENTKTIGKMQFGALFDACVIHWNTNIKNDGKNMNCVKSTFMALADVRIEEISNYFVDFAKYVDDLANFITEADKETEKN
ncbi:MAG: hypothetical protein Unbinned4497contig1000_29 [Prokaryotic dsDNA virus sp.]|nr:MAG: hypothetical protein Unbinned4497contig1000_29 [Prokaryotic dsDNA virus sp.]|tara:strand:+ start:15154 stop:15630 length:477 start_codon:yes stop_codon:yes gene_type:complete